MSDTEVKDKSGNKTEKKKASKIEDYLTGPRKKSKNYVIFAVSQNFDKDLFQNILQSTQRLYPNLSIAAPRNIEELSRHFTRMISLLVIDDEFDEPETVIKLVKILKETRRKDSIPVLFLTRNSSALIERYHKELMLYHELDEYVVFPGMPLNKILARIRFGVDEKNRRRSRRYQANIAMDFYHLGKDEWFPGRLIDISLHGALVEASEGFIFRTGDQIKIVIPVSEFLSPELGEFLKISAKARRVLLCGNQAAVSFEHVTSKQHSLLSQYLSNYVQRQMVRQALRTKAKIIGQRNLG